MNNTTPDAMRVADILATRSVGRMQSVGVMQVIPILGEDDEHFAPPTVEASTTDYGTVQVRNRQDRDTIIPPGSAWLPRTRVQDHALAGGALVPAGKDWTFGNAMCIQQSQPGLMPMAEHPLQILPARLRVAALRSRSGKDYSRLWASISRFKVEYGLRSGGGNLIDFLRGFEAQLDEFVAEFERVPGQIGAIVLVEGQIAGLELAPSKAYWATVWVPLIRVCYGALALRAAQGGASVPATRSVLRIEEPTVEGIARAVARAEQEDTEVVEAVIVGLAERSLTEQGPAQSLHGARLRTMTGSGLIGQIVTRGADDGHVTYASLTALGA